MKQLVQDKFEKNIIPKHVSVFYMHNLKHLDLRPVSCILITLHELLTSIHMVSLSFNQAKQL